MIYQVLPSISAYDAISQHVIAIDRQLKNMGVETEIVADYIAPQLRELAINATEISTFDNSQVLYHLSISSRLAEQVANSNAKVDLWYHNITPAQYFQDWEPMVALELRIARHQLIHMALRADRALVASEFSRQELLEQGCRNVDIMPVLFDVKTKIDSGVVEDLPGVHLLTVGRYAPHKKIEKTVAVFALYKELCEPNAVLNLVGSSASEKYVDSIKNYIEDLGVQDSVIFHESLDDEGLASLYKSCDVFLTMSDHEGFCVPLLEAIYAKLPVVATKCAAIPETLGDAGIALESKSELLDFVNAIDTIVTNKKVRESIIVAADKRMKHFDLTKEAQRTCEWILDRS